MWGFEQFYPDIFPNQSPVFTGVSVIHQVPWGYHEIKVTDGTRLHGYMQSEKYFKHCADVVRWHFEMNPRPFEMDKDGIFVHIRLGDYLKIHTHYNLGMDYYEKALANFSGRIYVFSDEP